MNFYKHHLGDYAAATSHLSWDEDCAYRRLLDQYYKREAPIPADLKEACRLARATTHVQRKAVDTVLREFFTLEADGWHQKRCDVEIAEANENGEERDAKAENEKERQRRHRAERKKLFEQLRALNVIPPWDTKVEALRDLLAGVTRHGPVTQPVTLQVTQPVTPATRTATAIQTPDSRLQSQTPEEEPLARSLGGEEARAPSEGGEISAAGLACMAMREAGLLHTNPSHPHLLAALAEGVTPTELADIVRECPGKPMAYVVNTARGRKADQTTPRIPRVVAAVPGIGRVAIKTSAEIESEERERAAHGTH